MDGGGRPGGGSAAAAVSRRHTLHGAGKSRCRVSGSYGNVRLSNMMFYYKLSHLMY